jgi:hypothetical protein
MLPTKFTVEYLARLWSSVVDPKYESSLRGRIKFALTPLAIIDLLAILPFYLIFLGIDLRVIRIVRLLRIARIAKLGRYVYSIPNGRAWVNLIVLFAGGPVGGLLKPQEDEVLEISYFPPGKITQRTAMGTAAAHSRCFLGAW